MARQLQWIHVASTSHLTYLSVSPHRVRKAHADIGILPYRTAAVVQQSRRTQRFPDLRRVKLKQKVAGCFRTPVGTMLFCLVRSYMATVSKHHRSVLHALAQAFSGSPFFPPCLAE